MKCIDDEIFLRYENDLLEGITKADVEYHLSHCSRCEKLFGAEKNFESEFKNILAKDHRVAGFASLVLEKLAKPKPSPYRKLAIAGSLVWLLAAFNSMAILLLILVYNDFSLARIIIRAKDILLSAGTFASIYSIYMNFMSVTFCMFAVFAFFIFLFFGILAKPQRA